MTEKERFVSASWLVWDSFCHQPLGSGGCLRVSLTQEGANEKAETWEEVCAYVCVRVCKERAGGGEGRRKGRERGQVEGREIFF